VLKGCLVVVEQIYSGLGFLRVCLLDVLLLLLQQLLEQLELLDLLRRGMRYDCAGGKGERRGGMMRLGAGIVLCPSTIVSLSDGATMCACF